VKSEPGKPTFPAVADHSHQTHRLLMVEASKTLTQLTSNMHRLGDVIDPDHRAPAQEHRAAVTSALCVLNARLTDAIRQVKQCLDLCEPHDPTAQGDDRAMR
jgi:hypothetical protein